MLSYCTLQMQKKKKSPIYSQQVVLKIRWPTKTWLHAEYMMKKKKKWYILVWFWLDLMVCISFFWHWCSVTAICTMLFTTSDDLFFFFCLWYQHFFFIKFCFSSSSLPNRPFLFTALDFQFHQFLIIKKNKDWLNCVTLDHTYLRMS